MARWSHNLQLKDLLAKEECDFDAHAAAVAPEAAVRVRRLAEGLKDDVVQYEFEEVAELFEDVPADPEACEAFNNALAQLYDLGDRYRVWIG